MGNLQFCESTERIYDELMQASPESDKWRDATIALLKMISEVKSNHAIFSKRIDRMELELRGVIIAIKEANSETANRLQVIERFIPKRSELNSENIKGD